LIEEPVLDFETAAPAALDAKCFAIDDPAYLRAALTERANPELVPELETKLMGRLFRRPILLNSDLEAGKSGIRRAIRETDHPRTIGQLANVHDLYCIDNAQLPKYVGGKAAQLNSLNSYHLAVYQPR
jgi:hypothetical protein